MSDNVIRVESKGTAKIVFYREKKIAILLGDENNDELAQAFEDAVTECSDRKNKKIDEMLPILQDLVYKIYQQGLQDGKYSKATPKSIFDKLLEAAF
jgi:hypothetical protein